MTTRPKVSAELTPVRGTALVTPYRWLDTQEKHAILADRWPAGDLPRGI
jgi:hypothetical protein